MDLVWTSSSDEDDDHRPQRRERYFAPRINFDFQDVYFMEKFRVNKECAQYILDAIGKFLQSSTEKNCALSPSQQV